MLEVRRYCGQHGAFWHRVFDALAIDALRSFYSHRYDTPQFVWNSIGKRSSVSLACTCNKYDQYLDCRQHVAHAHECVAKNDIADFDKSRAALSLMSFRQHGEQLLSAAVVSQVPFLLAHDARASRDR